MNSFHFYYPLQVRYGDLDAQWHVNNAYFLVFLEQTRFPYLVDLGLFDGKSFFDVGLIVVDAHIAYTAPIDLLKKIRNGCRVSRIGNKSMVFEYQIEEEGSGKVLCSAETVMVAYDYRAHESKPVPADWREKISNYEGVKF